MTDAESRPFAIQRGVKQGAPLSSLLFNALLEDIFTTLKSTWKQRNFGIQLGYSQSTRLTNLRFADDVPLMAPSLQQLSTELRELNACATQYGLELHPGKTLILSNLHRRRGQQAKKLVDIGGKQVQVLAYDDSTKYFGRKLTLSDYHSCELHNRTTTAWRKFHSLRQELTCKTHSLRDRLRLFNTTITPTILYGCQAWTLTKTMAVSLQRLQRRMLRLIIGTPRRRFPSLDQHDDHHHVEPWFDFLKRATVIAYTTIRKFSLEDWTTTYFKRKWRWAARIAQQPTER